MVRLKVPSQTGPVQNPGRRKNLSYPALNVVDAVTDQKVCHIDTDLVQLTGFQFPRDGRLDPATVQEV